MAAVVRRMPAIIGMRALARVPAGVFGDGKTPASAFAWRAERLECEEARGIPGCKARKQL